MLLPTALTDAFTQLGNFDDLIKKGDLDTARSRLAHANTIVRSHGLESGHLAYLAAVVYAIEGQHRSAIYAAEEAIQRDPMQPRFRELHTSLLNALAATFKTSGHEEPEMASWYELLVEEGYADTEVHLAWARHQLALGYAESAVRILDALAVLAPVAVPIEALRAEAYEAAGRPDVAERCRTHAAVLREGAEHPVMGHA